MTKEAKKNPFERKYLKLVSNNPKPVTVKYYTEVCFIGDEDFPAHYQPYTQD